MRYLIIALTASSIFWGTWACGEQAPQDQFQPLLGNVSGNNVNIRSGRGLNFEVISQLDKGRGVVVIGEEGQWYKIMLPKNTQCFVRQDFVAQGVVLSDNLRVRAGAGLNYSVLGTLNAKDQVQVVGREGDWLKIAPPANCSGWISKQYVQLTKRKYNVPSAGEATDEERQQPGEQKTAKENEEKPKSEEVQKPCPESAAVNLQFTGIVEDMGKIFNRPGTHKLVQEGKVTYYLRSDKVNLNRYTYRQVNIVGEVKETADEFRYPLIDVEEIGFARQ